MATAENDLGRNIIWRSGWMDYLHCEIRLCIARDDDGFYYAHEISPDHDQPMDWRGPFAAREIAEI